MHRKGRQRLMAATKCLLAIVAGISLFIMPLSGRFYIRSSRPVTHKNGISEAKAVLSLDKRYTAQKLVVIHNPTFEQPVLYRVVSKVYTIHSVSTTNADVFPLSSERGPPAV